MYGIGPHFFVRFLKYLQSTYILLSFFWFIFKSLCYYAEAAEAEKDFKRKAKEEEEKRKKQEEENSTLEDIKEQVLIVLLIMFMDFW